MCINLHLPVSRCKIPVLEVFGLSQCIQDYTRWPCMQQTPLPYFGVVTTTRYEYIWYSKQFLWDTCTCWYSEPYSTTPIWHSFNNVDPMDLDTRRFHKQSVWIDTSHISWKRVYKSTTYTANPWQCCSIMCTSHSLQYCTQACMYSMMEYQTHLHSRWHKVHLLFEQVWFI